MNNKRPNILWICTDQQRADTIAALGNQYIQTPNLDNLVSRGIAFTNAFCQNPFPQKIDHQGAYGGNSQKLPFASMTSEQKREVTAAYYGMITLIDKQIGRITDFLKSKELLENTLYDGKKVYATMYRDTEFQRT